MRLRCVFKRLIIVYQNCEFILLADIGAIQKSLAILGGRRGSTPVSPNVTWGNGGDKLD